MWLQLDFSNLGYWELISKLPIAAIFLLPAFYLGNVAQRHKRVSVALRSLGVRVSTFDAYLANIEPTEQQKIKAEMANVFFAAQISPDRIRSSNSKEVSQTRDLMTAALDGVKGVVRSSGGGQ